MADRDLEFLLKSYRFLDKALAAHSAAMTTGDRDQLHWERATAFRQLLTQRSQNASVALVQLRTLLECLAHDPYDAELAGLVAEASRQHLETLSRSLASQKKERVQPGVTQVPSTHCMWPDASSLKMLDASTDRIVILDTNYRYRFANTANAAFHGVSAQAFLDKTLWAMTSEAFFERVTKPAFDRCFAGQATACVTPHPGRDPSEMHSGHLDPILDGKGRVVGAFVRVRRVGVGSPEPITRAP